MPDLTRAIAEWYVAGLEHHADELESAARLSRLRAKRLDERYRGEPLTVFSEAMAAAAGELRKAAAQLRMQPVVVQISPDAAALAFGEPLPGSLDALERATGDGRR
jgi:hypothetical protein